MAAFCSRFLLFSRKTALQMRYGCRNAPIFTPAFARAGLRTSAVRLGLDEDFNSAKSSLNELSEDPGNDVKLKMYALFKQAAEGKNTKPKPGVLDFVGRAKWEAWDGLGDMSKDEAKQKYIDIVKELQAAEPQAGVGDGAAAGSQVGDHTYQELLVDISNSVFAITLNRPKKKNALTHKLYNELIEALDHAANDKSVNIITITGAGDMFCSGNDLSNFANIPPDGVKKMAEEGGVLLQRFVTAFIDCPKAIIGLINGPAVGISVTTLGLYDAVYATDRATFHTPFTVLGQSPEGCSSVVFPKLMGNVKASEMLLFNKKITAEEACNRNLVTQVFHDTTFKEETDIIVSELAKLPKYSLRKAKEVVRDVQREELHKVNAAECKLLVELWQSPECAKAIMDFFTRK